jgi:monolysocardiolipin acyltransferase
MSWNDLKWNDRLLRIMFAGALGAVSKANMSLLNTCRVRGGNNLYEHMYASDGKGLLTVSNHVSGLDDPLVLAALLPPSACVDVDKLRWTLCATDRCFKNEFLAWAFPHGKVLPVVRGGGIEQPMMDVAARLLADGEWLNVFPEGTRTSGDEIQPFRWGAARLIVEARPRVIVIYHRGMDAILPRGSYLPRFFKRIDVSCSEPIVFDELIECYRDRPQEQLYVAIVDELESVMNNLRRQQLDEEE